MHKIVLNVKLEAIIKPDPDAGFVSICPALDVTSQGKTIEASLRLLAEAVQLLLEWRFEHSTLDKVLHERGFTKVAVTEPDAFSHSQHTIEVPMELLANAQNNSRFLENPR